MLLRLLDVLDPSPEPSLEVALQARHTRLQGGTSCVAGTRSGGGGAPDMKEVQVKPKLRFGAVSSHVFLGIYYPLIHLWIQDLAK